MNSNDFITQKQYNVVTKTSGLQALIWLEQDLPDLIISDIQMTEMNGFDFLKEIRLKGYTKHQFYQNFLYPLAWKIRGLIRGLAHILECELIFNKL